MNSDTNLGQEFTRNDPQLPPRLAALQSTEDLRHGVSADIHYSIPLSDPVSRVNDKLALHHSSDSGVGTSVNTPSRVTTQSSTSSSHYSIYFDSAEESQVVWKFDRQVVAYLCAVSFAAAITRFSIGNEYLAGMTLELRFNDSHFDDVLNLFNVAYIVFQPSVLLWRLTTCTRFIVPWVVILWGVANAYQAIASNWASLMGLRFVVAALQTVFGQGATEYLGWFFTAEQRANRTMLIFSMQPLAIAVSAFVSYGATEHYSPIIYPALSAWRTISLATGCTAILIGIGGFWGLANNAASVRGLTPKQQTIAHHLSGRLQDPNTSFSIGSIVIMAAICFLSGSCVGTLPIFMPAMIRSQYYVAFIRAQLLTAPPFIAAFIAVLVLSWASSRVATKTPHGVIAALSFTIAGTGFVLFASLKTHLHARYGMLFLCTCGMYTGTAAMLRWMACNTPYINTLAHSMLYIAAHAGMIMLSRQFPLHSSRYYTRGCFISAGMMYGAALLALVHRFYLAWKNKQAIRQRGRLKHATPRAVNEKDARNFVL